MRLIARPLGRLIVFFAHIITAVRPVWHGTGPTRVQRIYIANHTSNGDFVLLWAALPPFLRAAVRPVAAADYWLKSPLRRFIGEDVFRAVLIDRTHENRSEDPIEVMDRALEAGTSLILFPEGTRNDTRADLLPFKPGLFHLAERHPKVEIVPVWIANLNRAMPKGEIIPIPVICSVTFGAPIRLEEGDDKQTFLDRARGAVLMLKDSPA
ncbi:lysophospholipid acyltransferase family protein [Aestuariibius sp. 2305UL40-4]